MILVHADLNLLTALDALLDTGSVSAAAERLHLTQPAMSRALGRIRRATGDQILVRSGRAMTLTPRAMSMRADVHDLLTRADTVLAPAQPIHPASVDRAFTIMANDAIVTAIGTELISRIIGQAPKIRLRLIGEPLVDEGPVDLRTGRIDLAISSHAPDPADIHSSTVGADRLVVVTRGDHPIRRHMSIEKYSAAAHISVSRRGRLHDGIDDALAARGFQRHLAATLPTTYAALHMVAQSEFLAVVPEMACAHVIEELHLLTMPLPFEVDPVPITMAWHRRDDGDHIHRWLRSEVSDVLSRYLLRSDSRRRGRGPREQ